jgi:hypothetical protein
MKNMRAQLELRHMEEFHWISPSPSTLTAGGIADYLEELASDLSVASDLRGCLPEEVGPHNLIFQIQCGIRNAAHSLRSGEPAPHVDLRSRADAAELSSLLVRGASSSLRSPYCEDLYRLMVLGRRMVERICKAVPSSRAA